MAIPSLTIVLLIPLSEVPVCCIVSWAPARHLSWAPPQALDTYLNDIVFRYNRRFGQHVSFERLLGPASRHHPTSYSDIIARDNPCKSVPTVRRRLLSRRTATGMQQDGSMRRSVETPGHDMAFGSTPLLRRFEA